MEVLGELDKNLQHSEQCVTHGKHLEDSCDVHLVVAEPALLMQVTTAWSLCHLNCKMRGLYKISSWDL